MHYVKIEDGRVVSRAFADQPLPPEWFGEGETWVASEDGQIGDGYDGEVFVSPPGEPDPEPTPRRLVPKSLVIARLSDEQIEAALAIMTPRQKELWRASDRPSVHADDAATRTILVAVGADPDEVLAP